MIGAGGLVVVTVHDMPVFKPNDFFWEHHWDGEEPKWQAYARVMQRIIANEHGLKLSDSNVRDKLEYRALKRGKTLKSATATATLKK